MKRIHTIAAAGAGALTFAGGAVAPARTSPSRLDDGTDLASQATIGEAQSIAAAQTAASGPLNEVDLERAGGRLVYNVDVGAKDVEVDANHGQVVAIDEDD